MSRLNPFFDYAWLKRLNWRYAVMEVVLIFMGITLATAFGNWNERRKLRKVERRLLQEIREEILFDYQVAEGNLKDYLRIARADSAFLSIVQDDLPCERLTTYEIGSFYKNVDFLFSRSAYESLKAKGVELVSNVELRQRIVQLYDFRYAYTAKIEEEIGTDVFRSESSLLIHKYVEHHLDADAQTVEKAGDAVAARLYNCDRLKRDTAAINQRINSLNAASVLLAYYRSLRQEMRAVAQDIEEELNP